MNPADYLDPTDALPIIGGVSKEFSIYNNIVHFKHGKPFPAINHGDIILLGIGENRNSSNTGASTAPDRIRNYLYSLSGLPLKSRVVDIGNIKSTKSPSDTYSATIDLIDFFATKKTTIIVIGGTQEISIPIYQAIKKSKKRVEISFVDSRLDIGTNDGDFGSTSYLSQLLSESQKDLFNISIIGYQGYLIDQQIEKFTKSNHETLRLGFVRGNFREVEPSIRDTDFLSFDLSAIRYSDCPGTFFPSPNGLYAEEACQLARYSGLSDKTCCFGVFELNTEKDASGQSAHLAAQLVWHFIEAYNQRKGESTDYQTSNFKKFIVNSSTPGIDMVFYKSLISDNWWMEIPTSNLDLFPDGKIITSCSYNDYVIASKQELPDRWIRIYNKMV
ncbi:MAG: arginase family protein [Tenuifilaceae bacterium]